MEPLSAFVLTAAFIATVPTTRRPAWDADYESTTRETLTIATSTLPLLPTPDSIATPSTQEHLDLTFEQSFSPSELLKREVLTYAEFGDGWNGDGTFGPSIDAIKTALEFIHAIPSRLPLPRPMLSSNGEIGLYWGFDGGYAEATFESNGKIVFFSRSNDGVERFDDWLEAGNLDSNWFWGSIGVLDVIAKAA